MVVFQVDVQVNPARAVQGAKRVEGGLQRVQNRADALRASLFRAFAIFGGVALIFRAVRTLADFEQSMSTVQAVTGATAQEFARLTEEAQRLGATTRFTATQAADGLVLLARAGFTVGEALGPGQIFDSNSAGVAASVIASGGLPRVLGIARDTLESLHQKLEEVTGSDLLITSAGVWTAGWSRSACPTAR